MCQLSHSQGSLRIKLKIQLIAIKTIVAIWRENMLGCLSADIIRSEKRTVFRERNSRKTVSYEEQIMSKDKYSSIFSLQMEAIIFIILQIFLATRAVLKIEEYINNSRHLARKYARIFVRGHYLFREANSFQVAKLEENCDL